MFVVHHLQFSDVTTMYFLTLSMIVSSSSPLFDSQTCLQRSAYKRSSFIDSFWLWCLPFLFHIQPPNAHTHNQKTTKNKTANINCPLPYQCSPCQLTDFCCHSVIPFSWCVKGGLASLPGRPRITGDLHFGYLAAKDAFWISPCQGGLKGSKTGKTI